MDYGKEPTDILYQKNEDKRLLIGINADVIKRIHERNN